MIRQLSVFCKSEQGSRFFQTNWRLVVKSKKRESVFKVSNTVGRDLLVGIKESATIIFSSFDKTIDLGNLKRAQFILPTIYQAFFMGSEISTPKTPSRQSLSSTLPSKKHSGVHYQRM